MTTTQVLSELHEEIAKNLLKKVKDGTASAAELAVAARFLKDNNIDNLIHNSKPLKDLSKFLPFAVPEEEQNEERLNGSTD